MRYLANWTLHPVFSDILVSDTGLVLSYKRHQWYELAQSDNGSGYLRVGVGHGNPQYVHILVAETFLPRPDYAEEVDHIDTNKYNNHVSNLEWVTRLVNVRRSIAMGLKPVPNGTPIRIVETGEEYHTQAECARAIGGIQGNIALCLAGKRRRHRGYTFEYVNRGG